MVLELMTGGEVVNRFLIIVVVWTHCWKRSLYRKRSRGNNKTISRCIVLLSLNGNSTSWFKGTNY